MALPYGTLDGRFQLKKTAVFTVIDPTRSGSCSSQTCGTTDKSAVERKKGEKQGESGHKKSRDQGKKGEQHDPLHDRVKRLSEAIKAAEARIKLLEEVASGVDHPLELLPPVVRVRQSCQKLGASGYYCVIVQYTTKLNAEKLLRFVRGLKEGDPDRPARKKYNFRHALEEIILSDKILSLQPPYFWMGGGEVDVKLRVAIKDFIAATNCFVGDIADPQGVSGER